MKMKTNLIILLLILLNTSCTLIAQPPTPTPRPTPTVPPTPTSTWSEETKTEEIEAEVQEIIDDTLPELASYVQQEGQDGEKVTTIEINDQDGTERLVSEEITIEMVPWIIVRGTLTEEETSSLAASAVEKYFTDIQAGNTDNKHHSQAAASLAGFSITSIQIEDPNSASASKLGEQKGMIRQGPDKNRKLEAITESFAIRVRIPVTVEYEIFGLPFTLNEKWDVTRPPTDTTWTFPTWGIRAAAMPGETVTLSENAITLDGIAQTNDSTLIVITTDKRQNTNTATLPSGTQNHFKMINYPRGYTWINETTDKSFPLRIRIESGIIGFGSENHEFNIELMP